MSTSRSDRAGPAGVHEPVQAAYFAAEIPGVPEGLTGPHRSRPGCRTSASARPGAHPVGVVLTAVANPQMITATVGPDQGQAGGHFVQVLSSDGQPSPDIEAVKPVWTSG